MTKSEALMSDGWSSDICRRFLLHPLGRCQCRSGHYNKTPQTGWFINHRGLFLTILGAKNVQDQGVGSPCLVRALCFMSSRGILTRHRGKNLPSDLFSKGTNPIREGRAPSPNHLPKTPLLPRPDIQTTAVGHSTCPGLGLLKCKGAQ